MDSCGPTGVTEEEVLKWHVSFGQNYADVHLDKRWHWERQGIDPDQHIADIRACGDRQAKKRGLMFIGEKRIGSEIQRQYVVPTIWWRLRFLVTKPRLEVPR